MVFFMQQGNRYRMTPNQAVLFEEKLPVGTYTVGGNATEGYYFERIDDLELPCKLYGNTRENANRILTTFLDRPSSTGILLSGQKGSGKTLLAKVISATAAQEHEIPTLVINTDACSGDAFNKFLQAMEQPAILIFDEFEKIFGCYSQQQLLTLLDGMYPSKKLFVLTSNERGRVDVNMIDRPGRVFYILEFEGVDIDFVRGYCQDNLDNLNHVPQVVSIFRLFSTFTFDILKALVEEMNRYKENPAKALRLLNARPDDMTSNSGASAHYDVELHDAAGRLLEHEKDGVEKERHLNLFSGKFEFQYKIWKADQEKEDDDGEAKEEKEEESQARPAPAPGGGKGLFLASRGLGQQQQQQQHNNGFGNSNNNAPSPWQWSNEGEPQWTKAEFSYHDLVKINSVRGVYQLRNAKGERLVLTRTHGSHALDLEWLCSLEEPLPLNNNNTTDDDKGGAVAGQVVDVVRLDRNNNHNGSRGKGVRRSYRSGR